MRVWKHVLGGSQPKLSGPDSFLLLGETQFSHKSRSPRQMVRLMFCQGSNSLFQGHQKEDSATLIRMKASRSVPASLRLLPVIIAAVSQPAVQIITPDSFFSSREVTFNRTGWQIPGWDFWCLAESGGSSPSARLRSLQLKTLFLYGNV